MIASPYDEQLARIPVSEHRVDVDGTETAWWEYGPADAPVLVLVHVRLAVVPPRPVLVPVVLVVAMGMRVHQRFVVMRMRVPLGEMQIHADRHEDCRDRELYGDRIA